MTESEKTKIYKEKRQERIEQNERRRVQELQELHDTIRNRLNQQDVEKMRDDWQGWRRELLEGYRYAPFINNFNSFTKDSMLAHVQERYVGAVYGPSEAEASFRLLLELLEARNAYRYEANSKTESIIVRLLHRFNYFILKKYAKTLDFDLLCIIPFRFRKN